MRRKGASLSRSERFWRWGYGYHQVRLKIWHQKKRYLLYILSFYIGLLFPAFCIANIRSADQVIYYTTFDNMEDSVQIEWFSSGFEVPVAEGTKYSVSAYYQEDFPQWNHQYMAVKGIDEHYFYPLPEISGRGFDKEELREGGRVCLLDKKNAEKYNCRVGDRISVCGEKLRIIGIMTNTKFEGIILPFGTMKEICRNKQNVQFTGIFKADTKEEKEMLAAFVTEELEKYEDVEVLGVMDGRTLYENALATKWQWRAVRGIWAFVSALFFLMNETVVLMGKAKKERQIIGIHMALGATEGEMKGMMFFETLLVTFFSAMLVLATLLPFARLAALESAVLLDRTAVFWFLTTAFFMCEILTVVVMKHVFTGESRHVYLRECL
ncbi:MAG: ABC transporter permease [Dorea sp.]|nr:ABC transporter permease [Dorea sp.]